MKGLSVLFLSLSFGQVWAQSQQIDIKPIKKAKDEIREIIRDFKIDPMESEVDSPEYRLAQMVMKKIMEDKQRFLESYLSEVGRHFEKDYTVLSNIKLLGNSSATKATVDEAKRRYKARAEDYTPDYQRQMHTFIGKDFEQALNQCLTVLCVNRVSKDIGNWIKIMSKVNIDLDLGAKVELKRNKNIKVKDLQRSWRAQAVQMNAGLQLVMPRDSQEFKRLSDPSISLREILQFGSKNIRDFGIENLRKYTLEQIKKHGLKLLDQYGAANLTKFSRKQLETYGADNLNRYGLAAMEKHPVEVLDKIAEQYGNESLSKYGVENLIEFTPGQIEEFGIDLLKAVGIKDLEILKEKYDMRTIRKYGKDLLKFTIEDLDKFGGSLLEKYGPESLQNVDRIEDLKALNAGLVRIISPLKALELSLLSGKDLFRALAEVLKASPGFGTEILVATITWGSTKNFSDSIDEARSIEIIILKGGRITKWYRVNGGSRLKYLVEVSMTKHDDEATLFIDGYGCSFQMAQKLGTHLAGKEVKIMHCPERTNYSFYMRFLD